MTPASRLLALSLSASADTIVVDEAGGPGVDFTTVEDAVAVADHGDLVLVREGDYYPVPYSIATDRAITLRADPPGADVSIDVTLVIEELAAANVARLGGGVEVRSVSLSDCAGSVVLDEVTTGKLWVEGCTNVRVVGSLLNGPLACWFLYPCWAATANVFESYVAFEDCEIYGESDFEFQGNDGSDGLRVWDGSVVRFRDSLAVGGFGTDGACWFTNPAGDGGHGILVLAGGRLLVEGAPGDRPARGGDAGEACLVRDDGVPGADLFVEGFVQLNGVLLSDFATVVEQPGAVVEEDPFAPRLTGAFSAGSLDLAIEGRPGGTAYLFVARRPAFMVRPAIDEPLLVQPLRSEFLGALDGMGTLAHMVPLPPTVPPGTRFSVQVLVTDGSARRLTNAVVLTVP